MLGIDVKGMKSYVILKENNIYCPAVEVNKRGFTYEEAMDCVKTRNWSNVSLICLEDEIAKYQLKGNFIYKELLPEQSYVFWLWNNAYCNNNINGFSLPIKVNTNEEYVQKLKYVFDDYVKSLSVIPFCYEKDLISDVKLTCESIISVLQNLIQKNNRSAETELEKIILQFVNDNFIVSDLDKSYSFRGIAPFINLRTAGNDEKYEAMLKRELTFFRARIKKKETEAITELKQMVHVPYSHRQKTSEMRFSKKGEVCLYLGTTSYVCSAECKWDRKREDMFVSAFKPNALGKSVKILNMTISEALINGIYNRGINGNDAERRKLQNSMLRIFPLVIATSFSVMSIDRECKYEYLISQCLMKVINKIGIDGIAYLSMQGKDAFQYPQGVNLAMPAYDVTIEKQYGKCCNMFEMTYPHKFECKEGEAKSYINLWYDKCNECEKNEFMSKIELDGKFVFYGETEYGQFDDYLISQQFSEFN